MLKFTAKVTGRQVAEAMRGDLEEAGRVIEWLAMPPDNGFAEDVAGYVTKADRGFVAEYLELIAQKLREEKD